MVKVMLFNMGSEYSVIGSEEKVKKYRNDYIRSVMGSNLLRECEEDIIDSLGDNGDYYGEFSRKNIEEERGELKDCYGDDIGEKIDYIIEKVNNEDKMFGVSESRGEFDIEEEKDNIVFEQN